MDLKSGVRKSGAEPVEMIRTLRKLPPRSRQSSGERSGQRATPRQEVSMRSRSLPRPRRLKALEQENRRLKRLYADLSLETAALKGVIAKKLYGP